MSREPLDSDDLRDLVVRSQGGDVEAFAALVGRYQDMVVALAYGRLGDVGSAEDVAQESFLDAYRKLASLRAPEAFVAWLRRIVATRCDRITRRRTLRVVSLGEALEPAADELTPAEVAERAELGMRVRVAVASLPEDQRTVTALFYLAGMAQAEVAALLSLPVSTINNRLHSARRSLERSLSSMVDDELGRSRPSRNDAFVQRVLRLVAPDRDGDAARMYAVLEEESAAGEDWRRGRLAHSRFDWDTSRIGVAGTDLVSIVGLYDLDMRVGSARVRTAGLNLDYTDPDANADGGGDGDLRSSTTAAAVAAATEAGYDMALALCHDQRLADLGFTRAWPHLMWFVPVSGLPDGDAPAGLQTFDPAHRDDLAALANADNELLTGTAVRPTYLRNKEPGGFQGYLWTGHGPAAVGYVSIAPEPLVGWRNRALVGANHRGYDRLLWHDDSAGDPDERLRVLARLAREAECVEIAFDRLHPLSALGRRVSRLRHRIEQEYRWYSIKVLNLHRTFTRLAPELTRRLQGSPLRGWQGSLAISNGSESVTLRITDGAVAVDARDRAGVATATIECDDRLAQLVVGTHEPQRILEAGGIPAGGGAEELLPVLFSHQHPQADNQSL